MEFRQFFENVKVELTEEQTLLVKLNRALRVQAYLVAAELPDRNLQLMRSVEQVNALIAEGVTEEANRCYEALPPKPLRQVTIDGKPRVSCFHDPAHYFPPL